MPSHCIYHVNRNQDPPFLDVLHYRRGPLYASQSGNAKKHGEATDTIQVSGVHFRVHRHFFTRESGVFKDLRPMQGASEETALIIDDTTQEKFERFLWVFYNP